MIRTKDAGELADNKRNLPRSSSIGLFVVVFAGWVGFSLVFPEGTEDPALEVFWSVFEASPSLVSFSSCISMISLVKSLSDRSENKLQIPKSSPWNSLQS